MRCERIVLFAGIGFLAGAGAVGVGKGYQDCVDRSECGPAIAPIEKRSKLDDEINRFLADHGIEVIIFSTVASAAGGIIYESLRRPKS